VNKVQAVMSLLVSPFSGTADLKITPKYIISHFKIFLYIS